jgi:hypothetical protein
VKNVVVIALLSLYMGANFQGQWILLDFYLNRTAYTRDHCENLEKGITTCQAGCFLQKKLERESERERRQAPVVQSRIDQHLMTAAPHLEESAPAYITPGTLPLIYNFYHYLSGGALFHPPKG